MDLKGSLVDTKLRIYPTKALTEYLATLPIGHDIPINILKIVKGKDYEVKNQQHKGNEKSISLHLNSKDISILNKVKEVVDKSQTKCTEKKDNDCNNSEIIEENNADKGNNENEHDSKGTKSASNRDDNKVDDDLYLLTSDIDWIYSNLQERRKKGETNVPNLHILLEGIQVKMPDNKLIKRNPDLEARCVKLRAQQEAREYRKMTKSVDNVRLRFPEDSISYQLKSINRQLIAIGQFVISIFAGFLFGFRGVEWMVGNLDFGFRLLLGVMCALVIALAEIYFLAKKLNEELNVPDTVQLGGPPKFAADVRKQELIRNKIKDKTHQD